MNNLKLINIDKEFTHIQLHYKGVKLYFSKFFQHESLFFKFSFLHSGEEICSIDYG